MHKNNMVLVDTPENLQMFDGQNVRSILDTNTKEIWIVAKDVAEILEYTQTQAMTKLIKDKYKFKLSSKLDDIRSGSILINERGLYQILSSTQSKIAEPFQDFLFDELLPNIRKNGYYISENLSNSQQENLVEEVTAKFNRRVIDKLRANSIEKIRQYLSDYGYTNRQVSALISSIYNHCHVATLQKTATMIVCDKVKEGLKKDSIVTTNTMRHIPAIYKNDYHSAINYYTEEELERFGKYFDMALNKACAVISNPLVEPSPKRVRDVIEKECVSIVREFSGLDVGTILDSKNRDYLNEIVDEIYRQGFIFTEEEKEIVLDELDSKRSRRYVVQ
jgi:prophage antirepressor-like protein